MNHGGNIYRFALRLGCLPEQVLDFSANINPEQAVDLTCLQQVSLTPYADPDYDLLKQAFKQRYPMPSGVDIEPFNGASAAIFALLRSLQPKDLVLYTPLYGEYAHIAEELGCKVYNIDRFNHLSADIPERSTVIFVNPSTPDGRLYDLQELLEKWQAADCTIIIDESFLDFCSVGAIPCDCPDRTGTRPASTSVAEQIVDYDKLYIIKSLSKFYGCAGIRIGFILAATAAIKELQRFEPAWKLSSLDMAYMQQALANTAFIEQTRQQTAHLRELLHQTLQDSGLFDKIYPGQANFLLARLADGGEASAPRQSLLHCSTSCIHGSRAHAPRLRPVGDGHQLQAQLEPARILIRVCDNFAGLDKSHVRFAVKDEQAIARLAHSFKIVKID